MIAVAEHAEGCVLRVRAQAGARKTGVLGEQNGALKVAVTARPTDGRANQALAEALREALGLKRSQVDLIGGHTSRDKRFLIRGVAKAELERWLAALVGSERRATIIRPAPPARTPRNSPPASRGPRRG